MYIKYAMMMWLSEKDLAGLLNTNNRRLLQPGAVGQPQNLTYLGIKAEFPLTPADQEEYLSFIPLNDSDEYFDAIGAEGGGERLHPLHYTFGHDNSQAGMQTIAQLYVVLQSSRHSNRSSVIAVPCC